MGINHLLRSTCFFGVLCCVIFSSAIRSQAQKPALFIGPLEKAVIAWCQLPEAQRAKGLAQFPTDPPNRKFHIQAALALYVCPPDNKVKIESYLDAAIALATGTDILTLDMVTSLLNSQNGMPGPVGSRGYPSATPATIHAAVRMLKVFIAWQPESLGRQIKAAKILADCDERDATLASLNSAMAVISEPERRNLRLHMLILRHSWERTEPLNLPKEPLCEADIQVVAKNYAAAKVLYDKVIHDEKAPLESRLAAWAGWLDVAPAEALAIGPNIIASSKQWNETQRERLLVWMGRELWRVLFRDINVGWEIVSPGISIQSVPGWSAALAGMMDSIITLNPGPSMRPDYLLYPISLRYPAALLFAINNDPVKSEEITNRRQDITFPPPPGGWRIFDGTPTPDTNKPRTFSSPTTQEVKDIKSWIPLALRAFPAPEVPAMQPLPVAEAQALVETMREETDANKMSKKMFALADIILASVNILDPLPKTLRTNQPPPPVREVDMTRFAPMAQCIREALAIPNAQKSSFALIKTGYMPAMLTASNPDLLDELFKLSIEAIDLYGKSWGERELAYAAKYQIDYLSARKVYDMSVYVQRYKDMYPNYNNFK